MFFTGLLLVCAMTHEGNVMTEQKVVLGHTRDNFTVATAALAPCRLLLPGVCLFLMFFPFFSMNVFFHSSYMIYWLYTLHLLILTIFIHG